MSEAEETARDERVDGSGAPEGPRRKTIEVWEVEKDVPRWLRAATRALHRFPRGRELLEEEFDAAVKAAAELPVR
ncbi:MAG: hypothetical protein HYV09_24745 [Deltaproteobacteria bacterium]|nr:hypothetical protein [Deltaproteobacteria bacterium]